MNTTIWCLIILAVSVVAVIILAIIDSKKNHSAATPPLDMKFGIPPRRKKEKFVAMGDRDTHYMDPSF